MKEGQIPCQPLHLADSWMDLSQRIGVTLYAD